MIDVYRGEQEPITNPIDYALFISFFPQLVAGPDRARARIFRRPVRLAQAHRRGRLRGLLLLVLGLAKKMIMADQFAQIANAYFSDVSKHPGMLSAWSGVIAFGIQIYFDFSGYTDMAIGMAKLLGFHFPVNFRRPYLASSITDFWHRWHISLSRWLRDYLYIPLGGNRDGRLKTYRNLMLTMLLGGLWHGASWNFVAWGGYHGALLSIERMFRGKRTAEALALDSVLSAAGRDYFRAGDDRLGVLPRGHISRQPVRPAPDALRAARDATDPPLDESAGAHHAAAGAARREEGMV